MLALSHKTARPQTQICGAGGARYTCHMENFKHRRSRYEHFRRFANPLINLGMELELPDFRPWCKTQGLPVFHVFLYCLLHSVRAHEHFMYRIYQGEVILIDDFIASYTVVNDDDNLNYAAFEMCDGLHEFVMRSVEAGRIAQASSELINTQAHLSEREQRNNVFTTCLPWMRLTAIEHPIFDYAGADIPCFAWGKFGDARDGKMMLPFSAQAHHGFVDGIHIHQLGQAVAARLAALMA
ncbi:MAG: CatA-like O-acetyltransferase [Pseudomonadota bacterium]